MSKEAIQAIVIPQAVAVAVEGNPLRSIYYHLQEIKYLQQFIKLDNEHLTPPRHKPTKIRIHPYKRPDLSPPKLNLNHNHNHNKPTRTEYQVKTVIDIVTTDKANLSIYHCQFTNDQSIVFIPASAFLGIYSTSSVKNAIRTLVRYIPFDNPDYIFKVNFTGLAPSDRYYQRQPNTLYGLTIKGILYLLDKSKSRTLFYGSDVVEDEQDKKMKEEVTKWVEATLIPLMLKTQIEGGIKDNLI